MAILKPITVYVGNPFQIEIRCKKHGCVIPMDDICPMCLEEVYNERKKIYTTEQKEANHADKYQDET